ncbi:MAG: hypothetical protein ACRD9R_15700 [Pyrinomonadaceae bacterium]
MKTALFAVGCMPLLCLSFAGTTLLPARCAEAGRGVRNGFPQRSQDGP